MLEPTPRPAPDADVMSTHRNGSFPRSRTMKLLMSGRGVGTAGAVIGGLLIARPALAVKLFRMLPTGAVARMLLVKGVAALRSKQTRGQRSVESAPLSRE